MLRYWEEKGIKDIICKGGRDPGKCKGKSPEFVSLEEWSKIGK